MKKGIIVLTLLVVSTIAAHKYCEWRHEVSERNSRVFAMSIMNATYGEGWDEGKYSNWVQNGGEFPVKEGRD